MNDEQCFLVPFSLCSSKMNQSHAIIEEKSMALAPINEGEPFSFFPDSCRSSILNGNVGWLSSIVIHTPCSVIYLYPSFLKDIKGDVMLCLN